MESNFGKIAEFNIIIRVYINLNYMSDKFENSNTVDTPKEETIEQQKEISVIKDKLEDLKKETQESAVVNTIVKSITEKKDLIEPDQEWLKEIGELLKDKKYGEALSKAWKVIGKLLKFKLQSWFNHLSSEEWSMKLNELIEKNNITEIQKYISQYEKSLSANMSLSDKSDISYLMSRCKDGIYDIAKKKEWKVPKTTTKYEYFTNAITNNWTTSPVWKVLLFNWWDFKYDAKKKWFDKAVQSASGSGWEHVALITGYNKEAWEIILTHSTSKWVHTSTLKEYFTFASKEVDVMSLDLPEDKKESVVHYVKQQVGLSYDAMWGVKDALWGKATSDNKSYYCSELINKWLQASWESIPDNIIYPGQMINILKPDYVTSIQTSEVK